MNAIIATLIFLTTFSTFASQPKPLDVTTQVQITSKMLILKVQNFEKKKITFRYQQGKRSSLFAQSGKIDLEFGEEKKIAISVRGHQIGKNIVHLETFIDETPGPTIYQPYTYNGTTFRTTTYADQYANTGLRRLGRSQLANVELGANYQHISPISPRVFPSVQAQAVNYPVLPYKRVAEYISNKDKMLPARPYVLRDGVNPNVAFPVPPLRPIPVEPIGQFPGINFRGNFSFKIDDRNFEPAWGFTVRLWQQQNGQWVHLGATAVKNNGDWALGVAPEKLINGQHVIVEYLSLNRFVNLKNIDGNTYSWSDEVAVSGNLVLVGNRAADTSINGDLPGFLNIYRATAKLWVKLATNGINPLKNDGPFQVTYPNSLSTNKCIRSSRSGDIPWSCSYPSNNGDIYLAAEHADDSTIIHELAHSIHFYFRDWELVPNSGGSHTVTDCYSKELVFTEGFANFMVAWTNHSPIDRAPMIFNFNIETFPEGLCNGVNNEIRVAMLLWDLYDYYNEGDIQGTSRYSSADLIRFEHQGDVVALILGEKLNTLHEYGLLLKEDVTVSTWLNKLGRTWHYHAYDIY